MMLKVWNKFFSRSQEVIPQNIPVILSKISVERICKGMQVTLKQSDYLDVRFEASHFAVLNHWQAGRQEVTAPVVEISRHRRGVNKKVMLKLHHPDLGRINVWLKEGQRVWVGE